MGTGTRNTGIIWSRQKDDIIRAAWADGTSTSDTATRLHVSEWSVRNRAFALGLPRRGHEVRKSSVPGLSMQRAGAIDDADRAATVELELIYCDWADRHGAAIHPYRAAA